MKLAANSLQFSEPASVAEEQRLQKDIVTKPDNKFEYTVFFLILYHFKPKNEFTFKLLSSEFSFGKIYPYEWRTTSNIVLSIFDKKYFSTKNFV